MRVVVPYAANDSRAHPGLYEETVEALALCCPVAPEFVDVSQEAEAYFRLLQRLWTGDEDIVVVEHDIVVHDEVFPTFARCRWPWCGFVYPRSGGAETACLGCTRFRKELQQDVPDLFDRVAEHGEGRRVSDGMPPMHWVRLDTRLAAELIPRGYAIHEHRPAVGHLNPHNS